MPRTSLDTAPTDSRTTDASLQPGLCSRVWNRLKKSSGFAVAAALVGMSANSADAQVMATPVYSDSGAGAVWPASASANAMPWPAVSPYHDANILSTQHVNQNGLWMKNVYRKQREFYFSAEAAYFDFGKPGDQVIGAKTLETDANGQLIGRVGIANPGDVFIDGIGTNNVTGGSALDSLFTQVPSSFILSGSGVFPYSLSSFDDTDATEATLDFVGNNTAHPIRSLGDLGDIRGVGSRLRWGFDNGDGTGFELTGFVAGESEARFRRGIDNINGQPITSETLNLNLFNIVGIRNGGVPIDNGLATFPTAAPTIGITGATQKYDILYDAVHTTHMAGMSASIFNTPVFESEACRVRFVWGGDYTFIDESFSFRGIDSGLSVDLTDFQSDAGQLPGGGGGGGGGGGQGNVLNTRLGDLDFDTAIPELTANSPNTLFETHLRTLTQSHLFGPTLGFRYELGGGKKFSIWGETIVGLLANFEKTDVDSHNFVEQEQSKTVYGIDPLAEDDGTPRPDDFTRAHDNGSHVHVSPMFKQGVHGELGLVTLFPKLRNHAFIEEGFFTAGYTVTVLGQVQRPGEGYYGRGFNGNPADSFPYVISDRSTFVWQEVNLGLEWTY